MKPTGRAEKRRETYFWATRDPSDLALKEKMQDIHQRYWRRDGKVIRKRAKTSTKM
jgi:hypothetical protein